MTISLDSRGQVKNKQIDFDNFREIRILISYKDYKRYNSNHIRGYLYKCWYATI